MKLVEQHVIKRTDPRYRRLDAAAFASKNLWNAANYLVRQSFIFQGVYLNNTAVFHLLKEHEAYQDSILYMDRVILPFIKQESHQYITQVNTSVTIFQTDSSAFSLVFVAILW
jgi:hypothetical protein